MRGVRSCPSVQEKLRTQRVYGRMIPRRARICGLVHQRTGRLALEVRAEAQAVHAGVQRFRELAGQVGEFLRAKAASAPGRRRRARRASAGILGADGAALGAAAAGPVSGRSGAERPAATSGCAASAAAGRAVGSTGVAGMTPSTGSGPRRASRSADIRFTVSSSIS